MGHNQITRDSPQNFEGDTTGNEYSGGNLDCSRLFANVYDLTSRYR